MYVCVQCAAQCALPIRDGVEVTPDKFRSLVQLSSGARRSLETTGRTGSGQNAHEACVGVDVGTYNGCHFPFLCNSPSHLLLGFLSLISLPLFFPLFLSPSPSLCPPTSAPSATVSWCVSHKLCAHTWWTLIAYVACALRGTLPQEGEDLGWNSVRGS